jgi:hypothetical protein
LNFVKKKQGFAAFNFLIYRRADKGQEPLRGNVFIKKRRDPRVGLKVDVNQILIFSPAEFVDDPGFACLPRPINNERVTLFLFLPRF